MWLVWRRVAGEKKIFFSQKDFLQQRGFEVGQSDVYPTLKEKDVKAALQSIWTYRVEGWWHYEKKYIELGICTQEQYDKALERTK